MKYLILSIGIILVAFATSFAQNKLAATSTGGIMAVDYEVQPKESLYSLSRVFNVPVAELAIANKFEKDKSLRIGEKIKIPLSAANFNQASKNGIPLYYTVISGGTLLDISKKFNNVEVKTLRGWNNLKEDELTKGQLVLVGYLVVDKAKEAAIAKDEKPKTETIKKEEKDVTKKDEKPKAAPKEVVKAKEQKTAAVEKAVVEKLKDKKDTEEIAKELDNAAPGKDGYFKKAYDAQTNPSLVFQKVVNAGIFKTEKGWNDGKYYVLMDGVAAGTIVKISNPGNDKIVYAKVLGQMKGVNNNKDYDIRMSDAAAALLEVTDTDLFTVKVTY